MSHPLFPAAQSALPGLPAPLPDDAEQPELPGFRLMCCAACDAPRLGDDADECEVCGGCEFKGDSDGH